MWRHGRHEQIPLSIPYSPWLIPSVRVLREVQQMRSGTGMQWFGNGGAHPRKVGHLIPVTQQKDCADQEKVTASVWGVTAD